MSTLHERLVALTSERHGEYGIAPDGDDTAATQMKQAAFASLKADIHSDVVTSVGPRIFGTEGRDLDMSAEVQGAIASSLGSVAAGHPLSMADRHRLTREVTDDVLGYGPISDFLREEEVTEIMVNSFDMIYVERCGKLIRTNARFADEEHLGRIIDKIVSQVGRRIDEASPMVDARLPDGSRVNAIIPPLAMDGACLTIRKFRADPLTMRDLVGYGSLTLQAATFLELCVKGGCNILVVGGTGSGKTTMLNVLSAAIPEEERIITIEDAAELQLKQEHKIKLEARPANVEGTGLIAIRDLVRNCLRMRPDRIIVGECRGAEAVDMLQAMNTGHDGSMTTIHANGPREAIGRLETLVLMAGVDLPVKAIREQIAGAIDLIVHVDRLVDGSRRVLHVSEVGHLEGDTVTLQDIFSCSHEVAGRDLVGSLTMTGIKPGFLAKLSANGVTIPQSLFHAAHQDDRPRTDTKRFVRSSRSN